MKVRILFFMIMIFSSATFAGTNRDEVMQTRENGWTVAWGKHVDHIEYVKLTACMVATSAGCINAYFADLLRDSVQTLTSSMKDLGESEARDIILEALKNPDQSIVRNGLEIEGGIATYNHWGQENPCSLVGGECWTGKISHPNTHQPFVRWRPRGSGDSSGASSGASAFKYALDADGGREHPYSTTNLETNDNLLYKIIKEGVYYKIMPKVKNVALDANGGQDSPYFNSNLGTNDNLLFSFVEHNGFYLIKPKVKNVALDADGGRGHPYFNDNPNPNNDNLLWFLQKEGEYYRIYSKVK